MSASRQQRHLPAVTSLTFVRSHYHPRDSLLNMSSYPNLLSPTLTVAPAPLPRGDEDAGLKTKCIVLPIGCGGPDCTLTHCAPLFSDPYSSPPTSGTTKHISTTDPITTYGYPTATGTTVYTATETGGVNSSMPSVGTSVPSETSNTDFTNSLTSVQIAGITVGSVLGAIMLVLFFWLLRRGTFGSGTLFGFRYGAARYPGWRSDGGLGGTGTEMRQERRRKGGELVTPFEPLNSTSTLPPSYPSSTLTVPASAESAPNTKLRASSSLSSGSHAPPPQSRSPTAWSTSPSAFDNAYGSIVASSTTGSGSHSAPSDRDAMSMSEVSTLVSDITGRSFPSTSAVLSYTPPPPSSSHPLPRSSSRWESMDMMSSPTAMPVRGQSPAPTVSTGMASVRSASSTIEGVRISSWHSSDSEETELIRPLPGR
ncbi:hypothetical protein L226DRAFT_387022 [Lentinus tigrinus ALCF2SS1-7]|uniref:Uncharacterized protein n=1 Tax=Lentinus tigrinus ALCF2SS1-6 TaxID=1328759 RepID=A0A5C2S9L6_9APHY|nr:hypothetical protein L227DRAFT_88547 [Lentinus tigrinus ALCF2SS1-6]RPD75744.1 hypothetical protein L226DRAFT_387022 [Lentinus tigrinus ALCF2SS1-7]